MKLILPTWLLLFGILICFQNNAFAQTYTSNFDFGTGEDQRMPVYGYYGYSYSQSIILANEVDVNVQGVTSQITKLSYFNTTGTVRNTDIWKIYIGTTSKTKFNSSSDWVGGSSLTEVFSDTIIAGPANTWIDLALNTPFLWDGTSNLVIGVMDLRSSYANNNEVKWGVMPTVDSRTIVYNNDYTIPDINNTSMFGSGPFSLIPKLKIEHLVQPCTSANFTGTHNVTLSQDTICANEMFTATCSDYVLYGGITYQWQRDSLGTWVDLQGANHSSYTGTLSQTTDIRVKIECTATSSQVITNSKTVTVNSLPNITLNFHDVAFCSYSPVALVASGANNYAWSPSNGLNQTSGAFVNASPTDRVTYVVQGTDTNNCINTDTVIVSPISKLVSSLTHNSSQACSAPSIIQLTIAGSLPPELPNNATWEYQFMAEDSSILQAWNTNNSYNLNIAQDGVYGIIYALHSSDCINEDYYSTVNKITVGFGGDANVTDYNCVNNGGTITVVNDFGQATESIIYFNDLNDPNNNAYTSLQGSAAYNNGRIELTPSSTSKSGSFIYTPIGSTISGDNSYILTFDLTADQPINTYGTGGADGIAYSFGDDIDNTTTNIHNGRGSKLRLTFDAADNVSNTVGIYLVYGKNNSNPPTPNEATTLAYSPNVNLWKIHQDVPVEMIVSEGKVTLYVAGTLIFDEIALPASYITENVSNWKHAFSAATGGDAMRQAIDNPTIKSGQYQIGIIESGNIIPSTWQESKVFHNLLPGIYDIWLRKDSTGNCQKLIKTVAVINTNPDINLGGDQVLCVGDSLLLDAGTYQGASYIWSGSNNVGQTNLVSQAGTYMVTIEDTLGCVGSDIINISTLSAPTLTSSDLNINQQGGSVSFTISNSSPSFTYTWDFGDGTIITNGPSSVTHFYGANNTYNIIITVQNGCGQIVLHHTIVVNTLGIQDKSMDAIRIYPNPTSSMATIDLGQFEEVVIQIIDLHGKTIKRIDNAKGKTHLNTVNWEKGIYFVHINGKNNSKTIKLTVM